MAAKKTSTRKAKPSPKMSTRKAKPSPKMSATKTYDSLKSLLAAKSRGVSSLRGMRAEIVETEIPESGGDTKISQIAFLDRKGGPLLRLDIEAFAIGEAKRLGFKVKR